MMEHSQVRRAIPLSFISLKVRRMKSLALLWATAGPDCRSLKLYWVSAKALTLPISHHGSSQLSLPSELIPSPEINTRSLCSLYTRAFPLLKSQPRISWYHPSWPVLCVSSHQNQLQLYRHTIRVHDKETFCFFALIGSWDIFFLECLMGISWFSRVVLQLKTWQFLLSWIDSLNSESQSSHITKLSFVKFSTSGAPREWGWASGGVIEGVWASDRSAGVMWQVRRCKAKQDNGLINPATPQFQWESLLSQPHRLCNKEVTEGTAQTSKHRSQTFNCLYYCVFHIVALTQTV